VAADAAGDSARPAPAYTYDQVLEASTKYFGGDTMAATTFAGKYALMSNDDVPAPYYELTPDDMHDRIAKELHRVESNYPNPRSYEEFRAALDGFKKVVPQGSPMYGIGNPHSIVSLSNCVVVKSPRDSFSGIMQTATELTHLYKRRAGVGLSVDTLRPESLPTNNAAKEASGAWSFSGLYSFVTRMVGQNGRRGALMITMDVRHPDICKFIGMKQDITQVTGANVSVMLGDAFMEAALKPGAEWITRWSEDKGIEMTDAEVSELVSGPGEWVETSLEFPTTRPTDEEHPPLKMWTWKSADKAFPRLTCLRKFVAADVWEFLNRCARNTAEPGLLFWDNYARDLPANYYPEFRSTSTNPCSEIALSPYDSCRLCSLNLKGFVKNPFGKDAYFDYEEFGNTVRLGMRIMDNIVDLEVEALERILRSVDEPDEMDLWNKLLNAARNGRRTGLGTHGLADALACMRVRYDSEDAIAAVDKIYRTLRDNAYAESVNMAKERGAFPAFDWEKEKTCPFIQRMPQELIDDIARHGRRNIALLTNAPTGSVSIISRTSSGIEPTFRHFYVRRKKVNPGDQNVRVDFKDQNGDCWQHFDVFERSLSEYFEQDAEMKTTWGEIYSNSPHRDFSDNVKYWSDELDKALPSFFVHSGLIDPLQRVRLQGVLQSYIDHGVSSTLNMVEEVGTAEVKAVYEEAWRCGLKGVTVYRNNCRTGVLVTSTSATAAPTGIVEHDAPKRPAELECDIHRATVDGEQWTIFVGKLEGKPYEVFGGLSENVDIPKKCTDGKIVKRKCEKANRHGRLSCYDLITGDADDPLVVRDIAVTFNDDKYGWATRQLSTSLRHGTPVKYIVEQMRRTNATSMHAFSKVMARVLGKYVVEEDGGKAADFCKSGNCE
jgi:ribonucleoside-diphosphate reductase alpha chain